MAYYSYNRESPILMAYYSYNSGSHILIIYCSYNRRNPISMIYIVHVYLPMMAIKTLHGAFPLCIFTHSAIQYTC